jgi:hypothetical protein
MSAVSDDGLDELAHLRLSRWAPSGQSRLVAITPYTISGRRIPIGSYQGDT